MAKSPDELLFDEWGRARDVLKDFDDRIHDLRKYGFTFITALFSVEGFLLPYVTQTSTTPSSGVPEEVKFAVIVSTALLIIVLRWLDGNYQGFQYGAAIRAIVIERFLNLELSDEISLRYEVQKLWIPKIALYAGFELAAIILGWFLLPGHHWWIVYLAVALFVEGIFYIFLANPSSRRGDIEADDWSLDRLQCAKGGRLRIMMTMLTKDRVLKAKETIWKLRAYDGTEIPGTAMGDEVTVPVRSSYVWSWKADLEPGIYRIFVNTDIKDKQGGLEQRELARKLEVI